MNVSVDLDLCDAHGQCTFAAPDVFELDDVGDLSFDSEPDESRRTEVLTAARLCPVQAIKILS
jgi:ferredoxin